MIGIVGVNHLSAPVEVRERLSFSEGEVVELADTLRESNGDVEVVVISTCNRTELYYNVDRPIDSGDASKILETICEAKSCDPAELTNYFYSYFDREAVAHLLRVVAGLDSMVIGENQILGQARDAYGISSARKLTSTTINRLFHLAFRVGKRVRTETGINEGASSASYAAVELASRIFSNLADHPVLLIGAGETGVMVLESLAQRGCTHLHVANRTEERARSIGARFHAEVADYHNLESILTFSDIVITSTAATRPIISREMLAPVMKRRHNRALFFIDLAVPRNIDDDVKNLDEVFLYDIDDLEQVVAHNRKLRSTEVEKAEQIVDEEAREFFDWLGSLSLAPTIRGLKSSIDRIGGDELRKLETRLSGQEFEHVERYTKYLRGKYLGTLVKQIKILSRNGQSIEYIDLVNRLFDLEHAIDPEEDR